MRNTRLSGHGLLYEGFDPGDYGYGRARCECGAASPVLPTTAARKRWHAQHKPAMRGLSQLQPEENHGH